MVFQESITLQTRVHGDMHDVTDEVNRHVSKSGVKTGVVHIFCVGSTAAVGAIEFEPGLRRDLPEMLDRLIPPSREYGHEHLQNAQEKGRTVTYPSSPFACKKWRRQRTDQANSQLGGSLLAR